MKKLFLSLVLTLGSLAFSAGAAEDAVYPFKVKLNGQEAIKQNSAAIFAVIKKPVPADAEIKVDAQGQVIVNAFKCDANGTPLTEVSPAILIFEAPKGTLDKTIDGKKLEAGKYLANVVAGNETSRIVFDVQ